MDDLAFNIPRRALQHLVVAALVIASVWGLVTGDSRKASELFTKELLLISTPIANFAEGRFKRSSGSNSGASSRAITAVSSAPRRNAISVPTIPKTA